MDGSIPTNRCSDDQWDEHTASLLDHRKHLRSWARLWFYLCGAQ